MKCPKCGYLGFEPVDRCRNCGYDFSLADAEAGPDLSIRSSQPIVEPLADLAIGEHAQTSMAASPSSSELPLFAAPMSGNEPLITRALPPRPPLAVRRSTPDAPRVRTGQPRMQMLDLDLESSPLETEFAHETSLPPRRAADEPLDDAGLFARFVALVIDLGVLTAIDVAVIYFTMQICGITLDDVALLPKAPLLAFLLVQNGGYLIAFTVGGQTLGKMASGIRVVTAGSRSQLDVGRAVVRTLVWILLAMPAGLGFVTAVFTSDHRGLHDRFAHTRVVRTSA